MRLRATALVLLLSLAATACGSRITDEQRAAALQQAAGGGAQADTAAGPVPGTTDTRAGTVAGDTGDGSSAGVDSADSGASSQQGGGGSAGGEAQQAGGSSDGGAGGGQAGASSQQGGQAQPADTRAAPEGGNGGATDVGVTKDRIVLGNVSDVSGPVPGIFEPSQLAVKAYIAYFTAREGTIYGRKLQYLPKDGRLDQGANRSASIETCEKAFMNVGSMSAMDQGAAPVIDDCGIPDVRTASTTSQMQAVDNAHPTSVSVPGVQALSAYDWVRKQHPEAVKKAAFLYICGEVTEQSTGRLIAAQEATAGYEYIYEQCIEIQETNYAPFVANMKDRGVEYVAFQGAYQQAARLASTMRQQDYWPTAYVLQSNAYNQNMLELAGDDIEGTYFITSAAVVEEMENNPELQLYAQWLQQVAPGERPTGLGMYSWSAAKLSVQLLKDVGPELTRAKMLEAVRQVDDWKGGGLHGPQAVGPRDMPTDCFNIVTVKGGQFTKLHPRGKTLECGNLYHDTR